MTKRSKPIRARSRCVWVSMDVDDEAVELWTREPQLSDEGWWGRLGASLIQVEPSTCPTAKTLFGHVKPGECKRVEVAVLEPGTLKRVKAFLKDASMGVCDNVQNAVLMDEARKILEVL